MKTKGIVLLIIAVAIVFVATCFAVAFAIGRKVDVVNGSITANGDNLSGVARINDDDLGFINIEWILQEKETSAETTTYVARITAIFTPGKAAIKAGENYGKWGCKSGYLHVLPACVNNDKITFVSATPIDNDDVQLTKRRKQSEHLSMVFYIQRKKQRNLCLARRLRVFRKQER